MKESVIKEQLNMENNIGSLEDKYIAKKQNEKKFSFAQDNHENHEDRILMNDPKQNTFNGNAFSAFDSAKIPIECYVAEPNIIGDKYYKKFQKMKTSKSNDLSESLLHKHSFDPRTNPKATNPRTNFKPMNPNTNRKAINLHTNTNNINDSSNPKAIAQRTNIDVINPRTNLKESNHYSNPKSINPYNIPIESTTPNITNPHIIHEVINPRTHRKSINNYTNDINYSINPMHITPHINYKTINHTTPNVINATTNPDGIAPHPIQPVPPTPTMVSRYQNTTLISKPTTQHKSTATLEPKQNPDVSHKDNNVRITNYTQTDTTKHVLPNTIVSSTDSVFTQTPMEIYQKVKEKLPIEIRTIENVIPKKVTATKDSTFTQPRREVHQSVKRNLHVENHDRIDIDHPTRGQAIRHNGKSSHNLTSAEPESRRHEPDSERVYFDKFVGRRTRSEVRGVSDVNHAGSPAVAYDKNPFASSLRVGDAESEREKIPVETFRSNHRYNNVPRRSYVELTDRTARGGVVMKPNTRLNKTTSRYTAAGAQQGEEMLRGRLRYVMSCAELRCVFIIDIL